jgi:formylglycine-generating enzyme required for sulfatase activity
MVIGGVQSSFQLTGHVGQTNVYNVGWTVKAVMSGNGDAMVAYQYLDVTNLLARVYHGGIWQPEVVLATTQAKSVAVAADTNGNFIVVWNPSEVGELNQIYCCRYVSGSWHAAELVGQGEGGADDQFPQVGMYGQGGAVVAWWHSFTNNAGIAGRTFDGTTWYPVQRLDTGTAVGLAGPGLAVQPDGTAMVIFKQATAQSGPIYANRLATGTWSGPVEIDYGYYGAILDVDMDGYGNAVAAFQYSTYYIWVAYQEGLGWQGSSAQGFNYESADPTYSGLLTQGGKCVALTPKEVIGIWEADTGSSGDQVVVSQGLKDVLINGFAVQTQSPVVNLQVNMPYNSICGTTSPYMYEQMHFSNDGTNWSAWEQSPTNSPYYTTTKTNWDLTNPAYGGTSATGLKRVYIQFRNNNCTSLVTDDEILYVAPTTLAVSPTALTPNCTAGQNAAAQSFTVWNSGSGTVSYTISASTNWLSCTPTGGSNTGEVDTIVVNYTTAGLAAGTYNGTITVTAPGAGGSPQTINVTVTVSATPRLAVYPTALAPLCTQGQNATAQSFVVWNSGGGTVNYTISASTNWLSCTPTSGSSTGGTNAIAVNYTTATLAAGTYAGTITVTAAGVNGSPQIINVTLKVEPGLLINVVIRSNTFAASWVGGSGTWLEKSLQVTGGSWVTVPGSEGVSSIQVPMTGSAAFFRAATTTQMPVITEPPVNLAVTQGNLAAFSVGAVGVPAPSYQWCFNGAGLSGATGSTFSISSSQPANVGDYTVVASVGSLSVTSSAATLVLLPPYGHLTWIPAGTFVMGSPTNEVGRLADEGPQTTVTLTRGFWIGTYDVTQLEYTNLIGSNPSAFTDSPQEPVEYLSWNDATNYCYTLTQREQAAGRIPANYQYRLPTEAEWEYACRAGTTTRFSYGDDPGYTNLGAYAWYTNNSGMTTHPVGQKLPNPWGLYDMHGNVWEWCQDWLATYPGGSVTNPVVNPPTGAYPIVRGGSYYFGGAYCRSAMRNAMADPNGTRYDVGLREVLGRTGP